MLTSSEASLPLTADTASTRRPPLLNKMPSPDTRVGMRPSTLQAISTAKPNTSVAAAIESNGRVTPTTWSSCSGFESRSMAASRKICSVPRFIQPPPSSTGLDLAGMLSFFQADIACQRGQSFDRPIFETQTFSLLAAWHSRSHAELVHIWPREQLSDIDRSRRHAKHNA